VHTRIPMVKPAAGPPRRRTTLAGRLKHAFPPRLRGRGGRRALGLAIALAAMLATMLGPAALAASAAPAAQVAQAGPARCRALTPAAVGGFFDSDLPGRLARDRVPGAVVSVVSGGSTVFAKGYGMADAGRHVAFDPARSLVRIGSVTKLFTWTAVMQQVQAGRLDLDADVNRYLTGFRIPATYAEPVTLRTLMNHTAGFEDQIVGTGARTSADVPPLGDYLAHHIPARIRPPGEISGYSNFGAALAGYIVGRVSGEPYDGYVRRHILDPLGMAHTTASEPVPAPLAAGLARSYNSDNGRTVPFTFDPMEPDGSISATAADLAHFMSAYLEEGRGILSPATVALMFQRSFAADPRLGGWAHGFIDRTMNGHRVLMHDGSWEGFESALILVPDCDLGLFMSTNGTGGVNTLEATRTFLDRFTSPLPAPVPAPATSRLTPAPPRPGFYERTRHNESTVEKLLVLLGPARLSVRGDGTLHFQGKDWAPQGGGLYALKDGTDHLAFLKGPHGRRYLATDATAYQATPSWQTPIVNLAVLLAFVVTALSTLAVPVAALWRRLRRRPAATTATWRTGRWLTTGAAALGLGFLVLLMLRLNGDTGDFLYGLPADFRVLLTVPFVVLAMTGAAAVCTIVGRRGAGTAARVHQVTVFAGLAALTWFLWQWNLIGW
jgi:CubicO group peptidase (beta-lactamase class C family)